MSISSTYLERWRAEREQQRRRDQLASQQLDRIRQQREQDRQRQARDQALRAQVLDALSVRKSDERKQEVQQKQQKQALLAETLRFQREQKQQQDAAAKQQESARLAAQQDARLRSPETASQRAPDKNLKPKVETRPTLAANKGKPREESRPTRLSKLKVTARPQQKPNGKNEPRAAGNRELAGKKRDSVTVQQKIALREKQLERRAEFRIAPADLPAREIQPAPRRADVRPSAPLSSPNRPASRPAQLGTPLPDDSPLSWLSTQGAFIIDENGNAVNLRGVTVTGFNTANPTPNQTVAQALSLDDLGITLLTNGWGVNLIRLPFTSSTILAGNIARSAVDVLLGLDDLIAQAEAAGCYVLLALKPAHEAPGILPSDDDYLCMRSLATRYRDQPAVLYEPFASTSVLAGNWLGIAQAVIGTIRLEHQASLIFMGNGKGTADANGLPLLFSSGDPIYNLVYTLRLAPSVMNTVKRESLRILSESSPLFVSDWSDGGPDFGRSSTLAADLIVRMRAGWAAANWNSEPSLVLNAAAHKFAATRWGMVVQRTLAQPVRPLLIPYGRADQAAGA